MNMSAMTALAAAGFLAVGVAATPVVAQTTPPASTDQGTTSGPAAGSDVEPSASAAKKAHHKGHHHKAKASADSAGAPGEAAKAGSESGPAPETPH